MRTAAILPWLFWMGTGFLLGGVMFCQLLPKCLCGRDIAAESDDHNPGAVNVFLLCGPWVGALCLLLDLLKGFGPVWLAKGRLDTHSLWFAGVMAAPVLGHAAGVFHHFQGGKCIATSFGVLAALAPQCWIVLLLAGLYLFFSTVWKLRPMARRSMVTFTLFGVVGGTLLFLQGCASLATGSCLIAATAIYRHLRSRPSKPALENDIVSNEI